MPCLLLPPPPPQGLLQRLDAGEVVVGDGSFLITLEKRSFVKVGCWTPEAVVEHPNAGQGLGPSTASLRTVL